MVVRKLFETELAKIKAIDYENQETLDRVREIVKNILKLIAKYHVSENYVNAFKGYIENTYEHKNRIASQKFNKFRDDIAGDIQSVIWDLSRYGF